MTKNIYKIGKKLFITSDEVIKEKDYFYQSFDRCIHKCYKLINNYIIAVKPSDYPKNICKKIILTTDQDLIADGVQAIDDKFLEWFVKNPSCEFVELKHIIKEYVDDQDAYGYDVNYYKIIIPKEDIKNPNNQEIMFHKESKEYFYEDIVDGEHKMVWLGKEEPKKDCFSLPNCTYKESNLDVIKGLCKICGNSIIHLGERVCVKSKQEKSYSEEDMKKCFQAGGMYCATDGKVYGRSDNFETFINKIKK